MLFERVFLLFIILVHKFKDENVFCTADVRLKNHKVLRYGNCTLIKEEYDVENLVGHTWNSYKLHGRKYLRIVFTVYKNTPPLSFRLRGYKLTSLTSRRKEDFAFDMTCRNSILSKMMTKHHINKEQINMDNCTAKPGNYTIPKLSLNEFSRFYKYTAKGSAFFIFEMITLSNKGVTICVEITMDLSANT